jgi:hypothetical protein
MNEGWSCCSLTRECRSPTGSYSKGHKPMEHDEFVGSLAGQQRYWSRSMVGWRAFSSAKASDHCRQVIAARTYADLSFVFQPNDGHFAVAMLQECGVVSHVVTQVLHCHGTINHRCASSERWAIAHMSQTAERGRTALEGGQQSCHRSAWPNRHRALPRVRLDTAACRVSEAS